MSLAGCLFVSSSLIYMWRVISKQTFLEGHAIRQRLAMFIRFRSLQVHCNKKTCRFYSISYHGRHSNVAGAGEESVSLSFTF